VKTWSMGAVSIAVLAVVIAALYAPLAVTIAVGIVLSLVFGFGWPHYLRIPARKTLGTVISLTGAGACLAAGLSRGPDYLIGVPILLALGVGAVFLVQLVRGTGQSHRLESTLGAAGGVVLAALGPGWIAAQRFSGSSSLVLITGVSAAVALGVGLIRWPDRVIAPLGIVLAALAGPLAALLFSDIHIVPAAICGAAVAAVLVSFRRLGTLGGEPRNTAGGMAMGIAPVAALGTLVYFIDKLLIS
jgi:hypothetical protein